MEKLFVPESENTPQITLDHSKDFIEIKGESRPENVSKFFQPIIDWLDQYKNYLFFVFENYPDENERVIEINFNLEYFNSSSAKYIMDLITIFKDMNNSIPKAKFKVNWSYDELDEDMLAAGQEFENMLGIKFNFIEIKDESFN